MRLFNAFCLTVLFAACAAPVMVAPARADPVPTDGTVRRMDQIAQSYADTKVFMGSVLVARDGQILLDKGYGYANLEWMIPDDPDTKYRLGSITKQFTAASILLLQERGKLKLDDPIKTYLPDAPAAWDKVTIYSLLTHTAGMPNFTNFPDFRDQNTLPTTPEKLIARFKDKPLDFAPGTKMDYSNSGYILLGYVIEKTSGMPYAQFVQENIFTPLGMMNSGYDRHSTVIPHRASGYSPTEHGPVNADYTDMSIPYAAGALYSTTHDLLKWEQSLFSGKLLKAGSLATMTTPSKVSNYALGLSVDTANGRKKVSHSGGIDGFNTYMAYFPDDKLTIIVLGNLNGMAPDSIGKDLETVAYGGTLTLPSEHKAVAVAADKLQSYVGSYELAPGFAIAITLEDGNLMAQGTGQPKFALFADSDTLFFARIVEATIEFLPGPDGKVTKLILHQGGRDMTATRK